MFSVSPIGWVFPLEKNPLETEHDLQKQIPKEKWGEAHHWLIWHGRKVCKAPNPRCSECPVLDLCPSRVME